MSKIFSADPIESQTLINKVVLEFMKEQRRRRRWRWIMRIIVVLFLIWIISQFYFNQDDKVRPHAGLIDINGSIFDTKNANAEDFVKGLDDAYKSKGLKAILLRINSPGGSPVQADYMYNSLKYYQKKYPKIRVYAICVDLCASAAYYVAAGAQEIYANPASMVGSIGVLYNGFGLVDVMQKVGVTRRLQTAGKNKGFLDPFSPERPEDQQILQSILNQVHLQFINKVREGRGNRLKIDADTFSGLFWTGEDALHRGLIDGFASAGQIAREKVNVNLIIDYTHKPSLVDRFSKNIGTAMADHLPVALGIQPGVQE